MKKIKTSTLSLLLFLLLIPFMRHLKAQVPTYVGVAVDDYYEFDHNLNVIGWADWRADNMNDYWDQPFGHLENYYCDMGSVFATFNKEGAVNPMIIYRFEIDSITENISSGRTEVNANVFYDATLPQTIYIGNDTAKFAEDSWYGALATSPFWVLNAWLLGFGVNTLLFAPTNVNWMDFADECNTGLETMWKLSGDYGYNLTMSPLSDGFTLYSPIMGFGNNLQPINITVNYDVNGILNYYSFSYGSNLLTDIVRVEIGTPEFLDIPDDFTVDYDYTGVQINWTVTSGIPDNYAILRQLSAGEWPAGTWQTEVGLTPWYNGIQIVFNVSDGLAPGDYLFRINLEDKRDNTIFDEVIMTVRSNSSPNIPGYDLPLVISLSTIATIGIIILKKKKK
ncbi:MAG: Loki-CTERM sorting domain-containing protein [Candidatus Hodarchaeales archaeon]